MIQTDRMTTKRKSTTTSSCNYRIGMSVYEAKEFEPADRILKPMLFLPQHKHIRLLIRILRMQVFMGNLLYRKNPSAQLPEQPVRLRRS